MAHELADWNAFAAWETFLPTTTCLPDTNPYQDLDLDRTSWFVYVQMTSPLPVYIHSGWWSSYPGIEELANHLRYALLPQFFATWLCRDEWDPSYVADHTCPIELDDLFARARKAQSRYVQDLPLMQQIASLLDKPSATAVRKAVKLLNERWAETHTWSLQVVLFSSILAMGKHLRDHETSALTRGMTRAAWLDLCRAADEDLEAARQVLAIVQHAERFF